MKRFLLMCVISSCLSINSYAQQSNVGLDATPASTLTVNGSIAARYVEVKTTTYTINDDDYNIAFTGGSGMEGTFTLPLIKNDGSSTGRMYHIKNLTKDKTLKVITSGSQIIRFGGTPNNNNHIVLGPGRYINIVVNSNSDSTLWDINMLGMSEEVYIPEVKTLEYVRKSVPYDPKALPDKNVEKTSEISIGNLSVRFSENHKGYFVQGFVEFRFKSSSHVTNWYTKTGKGLPNEIVSKYCQLEVLKDTWYSMCGGTTVEENINPINRDSSIGYITNNSTGEVYRITTNVNGQIAASGTIAAVSPSITIFVEKLD